MDIPNKKANGHHNDSERVRLIRENSAGTYLSSSAANNYYGSTPTKNLKIPNVNSITDLNEVEQAFNSYNSNYDEDEIERTIQLAHRSSQFKNQLEASANLIRMDSEASSSNQRQLTNSSKTTTHRMNQFVSSGSVHLNSISNNGDTNSLYHYMIDQRKNQKAQIYESLDYEINENLLYLMEKKKNLRSKQNASRFTKYIKSYFPSKKEFSRWLIIFLIGIFTALTACFIRVNVETFSELKYDKLKDLFNFYLAKNQVAGTNSIGNLNSTTTTDSNSKPFQTLNFDKDAFTERLFKLQIPLLFWFLTNAIPVFLGSALVT